MIFQVILRKEWIERGCVQVEAEDEDEARYVAQEMLEMDDGRIEWADKHMEPGDQDIESVEEVDG